MSKLEHKVPTFAPGPVKKEIMVALRDIALDEQNIRYNEHIDGIISGCGLIEEGMKIGLVGGIVKFAGRLYKLKEKALVHYEHTDDWTVLKLRFSPQIQHKEYIHYTAELTLDDNVDIRPNEMEMGRFKLKKGSRLRTAYKDFWDMATEYDTVNLVHVKHSMRYNHTLHPAITAHFARDAFEYLDDNSLDCAFCTACLAGESAISRELIERYIANRLEKKFEKMDNSKLHAALGEALNLITGRSRGNMGKGRKSGVMVIN